MPEINIGQFKIGPKHPPFIVAEISANHNQSFDRAIQLVDAAKQAGAHAIKLQTYTADTMTLDLTIGDFSIRDPDSLWYGKTLYKLYQEAYTPWEWHAELFQRAKKHGMIAFSSPFDATAVDFLESLNVPCYKIASLEITDLPLIQKAASTGKPLIISTGAATLAEIDDAVTTARRSGCKDLVLLKCTAAYPAPASDANLRTIPHLAMSFGICVGLSDHSLGIGVALASIPYGACLIEKHFTLSRDDGGVDAAFSLDTKEMKALVTESRIAWEALGKAQYGPIPSEQSILKFRRSLYFVKNLKAGEVIKAEHIRAIRPGGGLSPKDLSRVIGLCVAHEVKTGDPVKWETLQHAN